MRKKCSLSLEPPTHLRGGTRDPKGRQNNSDGNASWKGVDASRSVVGPGSSMYSSLGYLGIAREMYVSSQQLNSDNRPM